MNNAVIIILISDVGEKYQHNAQEKK